MMTTEAQKLRDRAAQCRMLAQGAGSPEVAEMLRDIALGFLARAQAAETGVATAPLSPYEVRPLERSPVPAGHREG
jgi:hypothetical protein